MLNKLTQSILVNSLKLGFIAILVAIILASIYNLSAEKIAEQKRRTELATLSVLFPANEHDNQLTEDSILLQQTENIFVELSLLNLRESRRAYIARVNGEVSGIILPALARDGYNGDISLLIGVRVNGELTAVRVTQHRETPGLGDKIDAGISDWILGFSNHSLSNPTADGWTVKNAGGDFDQFTGATITPRAVTETVRDALTFFELNKTVISTL